MGRKNANAKKGGTKQQQSKTKGSPRRRHSEHYEYNVMGAGPKPNDESRRAPQNQRRNPQATKSTWPSIFRIPLDEDARAINSFLRSTGGKYKRNPYWGIRYTPVMPSGIELIYSKFDRETADTLKAEYLREHSHQIPYGVNYLYQHVTKTGQIQLGADPTEETRRLLEWDIEGLWNIFGISDPYPHKGLIIGRYPTLELYNDANTKLTNTLLRQGGVLLTFGGVQL